MKKIWLYNFFDLHLHSPIEVGVTTRLKTNFHIYHPLKWVLPHES